MAGSGYAASVYITKLIEDGKQYYLEGELYYEDEM